ncbi:MAG: Hsp70 family protein [Anaerolinea sp.]|nr:Hsp70 family protein [Anaerolinea sp.]
MGTYIGIDLGTTFSAAAWINSHGEPEVVPNPFGKKITPSVIDFSVDPPEVGDGAKEKQRAGETQIASFFKTLMIEPDQQLYYGARAYTPVDLSALLLRCIKDYAAQHLGQTVTDAVITVPAYFTDVQRGATLRAGIQAGLNVLRIINEPTAAALAYRATEGTYLIYDLGGGTFDVSIVRITPKEVEVIATDGEHELGGRDWDNRLLNYLSTRYHDDTGVELIGDNLNELRVKVENAKRSLSERQSVRVTVDAEGGRHEYEITRDQFNEITADLMERTRFLCEKVIQHASEKIPCNWTSLKGVLLVGGSTRMPMVREYVTQMIGRPPLTNVNPDEAVALGAAVAAAQVMAKRGEIQYQLAGGPGIFKDITAHSLGMIALSADNKRYLNSILIKSQSAIPVVSSPRPYELTLGTDMVKNRLEIFITQGEGDDPLSTGLRYLELRVATGIPQIPGGKARIEVTYGYNQDGIVEVTAVETSTHQPLIIHNEPLPADVPARFAKVPKFVQSREPLTIYVVIDVSGSMCGHPMDEAKKAALGFVEELKPGSGVKIGILSVSDRVGQDILASENAGAIRTAINKMYCGQTGGGNAADPFRELHQLLQDAPGKRIAVVLADGVWDDQKAAVERAHRCHHAGIDIIGICFGGADRDFMNKISSAGRESLKAGYGQLGEAFGSIAREIKGGLQTR